MPLPSVRVLQAGTVQSSWRNLFDPIKVTGGVISNGDGSFTTDPTRIATDFIPVNPSTSYVISGNGFSGQTGGWFDSNKKFLAGVSNYNGVIKISPSNAAFIRFTIESSSYVSTTQIEQGAYQTSYQAYHTNKAVSITGRKNLLDPSAWVNGRIFDTGFPVDSFTVDNSTGTVTGFRSGSGMVSQLINVIPYTDYTFNGVTDANHPANVYVYTPSGGQIVVSQGSYPYTFNSGGNNQVIFSIYKPGVNTSAYMILANTQLEKGSTATAFESYIAVPDNKPAAR